MSLACCTCSKQSFIRPNLGAPHVRRTGRIETVGLTPRQDFHRHRSPQSRPRAIDTLLSCDGTSRDLVQRRLQVLIECVYLRRNEGYERRVRGLDRCRPL
jgi:hypothetical protein